MIDPLISLLIDPFARTCSLPFYRRPGPLPPNVLAGRVTTRRRRERWVHDKGRVHGRGPRQGAASLKLKSRRPTWAVVGAAEVRGAAHGDARGAGVLFISKMARPEASLAWCSFIDCFMHEDGDGVADVIPCALCRGGRDNFTRKEPSRGLGASRSSAWSLAESKATPLGCPLEDRSLARLARLGEPGP